MSKTENSLGQPKEIEAGSLEELLGDPGSITITGEGGGDKGNFFSKDEPDTAFLDIPGEAENKSDEPGTDDDTSTDDVDGTTDSTENDNTSENQPSKKEVDDLVGAPGSIEEEDDDDESSYTDDSNKNKGGRKPALVEALKKLTDSKVVELFEDQQDLDSYTIDDVVDLFQANLRKQVQDAANKAPLEVFKRLDPKVQDIIAFQLNGGTDVTSLLKVVAQSQEVTELSLENESDQERIVREYYRSINFGTQDEIEDEIDSLKDRGDIEKKATQFKPKLDEKQAAIMQQKLDEQERKKEAAQEAKKHWDNTIFNNLNRPDLNGIPLSNKTQTMLFHGLTDNTTYQDRNGNPTNALGHLIEEYQYGKNANPSILLEALWLMANPAEYRQNVIALGNKKVVKETFRNLKTAEGEKISSSNKQGEGAPTPKKRSGVKRTPERRNMFTRPNE